MNLLTRIGGALFGDKGLAGGVVDTLQSIGLLKDPKEAQAALERMKALELRGEELDLETLKVEATDRDSARKREIEVKDATPRQIAWVSFIGFFLILAVLMFVPVPATAKDALLIMLGTLAGIVTSITAYYYGSSAGSARKNETIDKLVGK